MTALPRFLAITLLLLPLAAMAQTVPAAPMPAAPEPPAAAGPEPAALPTADESAVEPAVQTGQPRRATMDRLELDPTTITGNRELPKVMVIVPWKRSDLGELQGRPANSLLNEILSPVDRDVFRREMRYFDVLDAEGSPGTAGEDSGEVPPSTQPEN